MELLTGPLVAVVSQLIKLFSKKIEAWFIDVLGEKDGKKFVTALTLLGVFSLTFVAVFIFRYFRLADASFVQELFQSFSVAIASYEVIIKRLGIFQK